MNPGRLFQLAKSKGFGRSWRVPPSNRYDRGMTPGDYERDALRPESAMPEGDQYRNKWVAVQAGHVIVAASTHQELVRMVRGKGIKPGTFVARHVEVPPTEIVVGVG